jgi:hypothetical protein
VSGTPGQPSRLEAWRRRAVSIEAAAFTGVLFVVLYLLSLALIRQAVPGWEESPEQVAASLDDSGARSGLLLGYGLTPFAAIAFLWFTAVIYRRIPPTGRFISTVFIGGSTLFIAIYVVATTVVCAPYYIEDAQGIEILDAESLRALQSIAWALLFVVATRIQVLVVLSVTVVGRQYGVLPRWLVWFGYLIAVVQILNLSLSEPLIFFFPLWILAVSITLAVKRDELPAVADESGQPTG